jgi:hypothetical protein
MDLVGDALADGRRIRVLNIVDDFFKLSPAVEVDTSLPGLRVIRTLERDRAARQAQIDRDGQRTRIHLQGARPVGLDKRH